MHELAPYLFEKELAILDRRSILWRRCVCKLNEGHHVAPYATENCALALAIHAKTEGALGHIELKPYLIARLDPFDQH